MSLNSRNLIKCNALSRHFVCKLATQLTIIIFFFSDNDTDCQSDLSVSELHSK